MDANNSGDLSGSTSASPLTQAVNDLDALHSNAENIALLTKLDSAAEDTISIMLDMPIKSIADIFMREQLFGELRGLRRYKIELEERCMEVKEFLKQKEKPESEQVQDQKHQQQAEVDFDLR